MNTNEFVVIASSLHHARKIAELIEAGTLKRLYHTVDDAIKAWDRYPTAQQDRYSIFSVGRH